MAVLLPTLAVKHVTDITPEMLHVMKVKGMILDVDNTLSRHGCPIPFEGSIEWTHEMRAAGIKVIIVSNNFKKRVSEFYHLIHKQVFHIFLGNKLLQEDLHFQSQKV